MFVNVTSLKLLGKTDFLNEIDECYHLIHLLDVHT